MSTIKIHNVETDEIIEREMNSEELAQWEAEKATTKIKSQEAETKESARQALLDKLGITEEEAKLLLS
jgi:FMN-dependent NADH-azoreductase